MLNFVIIDTAKHELIVEKSRFIAYISPINSEEDFVSFKKNVKKDAPGARHYPYAYSYESTARASDDGEPSGTAGRPLLELINNHNLNNLALIVVRYFGGTLLGAGRLLRTYVDTANQALNLLDKYIVIESQIYEANIKSADLGQIEYLLAKNKVEIIKREYNGEEVRLTFNAEVGLDVEKVYNLQAVKLERSKLYRKEE